MWDGCVGRSRTLQSASWRKWRCRSEERFRGLSDASFEGICFSDGGTIVVANKRLAEMLGCEMQELVGSKVFDWVAPESLEAAKAHIGAGSEEPYQHLLRRKDNSTCPAESQARNLPWKGKKVRVTAIRDISDRKRSEQMLRELAEGTASVTGRDFLTSLVRHSAAALHAQFAFVSEMSDGQRVRTTAFWNKEGPGENFEYDIKDTPCERVLQGQSCISCGNLWNHFPKDATLAKLAPESYLGVPLFDSTHRVIGHLAVLDSHPLPQIPKRRPF